MDVCQEPIPPSLRCQLCSRTFRRREHLDRHMQSHSGAKTFLCPRCPKAFSRRDSLQRHLRVHGISAAQSLKSDRTPRACQSCSREKRRCSGDLSCRRCETKSRSCSYETSSTGTAALTDGDFPIQRELYPSIDPDSDPYDLSFSLPDLGFPISWMPQNDHYISSDLGPHYSPGICPPLVPPVPNPPPSRPLPSFPELQPSDYNVLNREYSAHVSPISAHAYQEIMLFYKTQQVTGSHDYLFPDKVVLDAFIQLYFEHFDPHMPFLYHSLFGQQDTHWILVLAVAAVGSQYTAIENRAQYIVALLELLRRAFPDNAITVLKYDMTMIAQSTLLHCIGLLFCGYRDYLVILEQQRAWLATLLQPSQNLTPDRALGEESSDWRSWVRAEGQRRLHNCAWLFECMAVGLLDVQPKLQGDILDQRLPAKMLRGGLRPLVNGRLIIKRMPVCSHIVRAQKKTDLTLYADGKPALDLRTLFMEFCISELDLSQLTEMAHLLLLAFWIEERKALKGNWMLSVMHGNTTATCVPSDRELDEQFTSLQSTNPRSPHDEHIFQTRKVIYHILFILRHVPLKSLHTYFGWRALPADIQSTRQSLSQWISDNPEKARRCVFHAASAFCHFRTTTTFHCIQPLCLLIVVQYLQIYQREHTTSPLLPERSYHHSTRVLRINPSQTEDDNQVSKWISGEDNAQLYLPGVGILLEPRSSVCLLNEFERLLSSPERAGWPIFRAALRVNVEEILHEVTPLSQPPYSVDLQG